MGAGGGAAEVGHAGMDLSEMRSDGFSLGGGWYGSDLRIPVPLIDNLFI